MSLCDKSSKVSYTHRDWNIWDNSQLGTMVSQITSLTIVYSDVYSGADQREHQSSASLAFVRGIHRWPVNSPRKGPVTRKIFPFDDVIMMHDNIRGKRLLRSRYGNLQCLQWIQNWFSLYECNVSYTVQCIFEFSVSRPLTDWWYVFYFNTFWKYLTYLDSHNTKHQSSASLAFVRGIHRWLVNSPHKGPFTPSFNVFINLYLNKRFSKHWWRRRFETPSRSLWRHCNVKEKFSASMGELSCKDTSVSCKDAELPRWNTYRNVIRYISR